jgi:hypothetical protein
VKHCRALVIVVIAVAGVAALTAYSYEQGIGPFARGAASDAPMELAAGAYPCGGADAGRRAGGVCQVADASAAVAGGGTCAAVSKRCSPDPTCCPDGCPSIQDGKCAHAGNCICPKNADGCPSMKDGKCAHAGDCICPGDGKGCAGSCAACPAMKAGTCQGVKGGKCGGMTTDAAAASAQACHAQTVGGCPMAQAASAKQVSCQTSCPFSSR